MKPLLLGLLLVCATPALANDAASLLQSGRYAEAITAGEGENTASSRLIAGRARLQIASYSIADKARAKAAIAAAIADFDAALAKSPGDLNTQLQRVIAEGFNAKLDKSPGGAKAMRKSLDALLKRAPDNALAWSILGGWHGGAVATVGKFIASTVMGANLSGMSKAFDRAMLLDPREPAHPIFYALTLLDISTDNAPQAKALLTRALALPGPALDPALKPNGAKVLAQLGNGDAKAAQAMARRVQPFGLVS
jgi:tetratricopeptide (TPR) repeat protein